MTKIKVLVEIDEETYNKYVHWHNDSAHTQEAEEIIANGVLVTEDEWTPVSCGKLPKASEDVLVYDGEDMFVAWCDAYNRWNSSDNRLDKNTPIRQWRHLPHEPYETEADK